MDKQPILIAMSGGVDSSVAALLLKDAGCNCIGITMRLFDPEKIANGFPTPTCGTASEAEDARRIAAHLGIPFHVMDFSDEFQKNVIDYFIETYIKGVLV